MNAHGGEDPRSTRRDFLCLMVIGAASGLIACVDDAERGAARLVATLADPAAAARVGAAYLARTPSERNRDRLVALLKANWDSVDRLASDDRTAERLRRQHLDDLEHGRHVRVEGWVVSLTEARLGALASLSR